MPREMMAYAHGEVAKQASKRVIYRILCLFCLLALPASSLGAAWPRYTATSFQSDVQLANSGNVTSQLSVAKAYYAGTTGISLKRNYFQAAQYFQSAANQGSAEAQAWLGSLYLHGHGVARNLTTALNLIQASANSNNPVGLRFLALMYQRGEGVTQSYSQAVTLLNKATSLNDPEAYDRLANLYLRGLGVARNVNTAVNMFNQGINLGDSWSQLHLGELYAQGLSPLTKNVATALSLYTQSAAKGNYKAAFRAAVGYETGTGAAQNSATAWSYYKQAALNGFAPAQRAVGRFYQNGLGGNAVDLAHAYVWYTLAAEQGDSAASSMLAALGPKMTAAQVQQAQTLINTWENNRGGLGSPGQATVTIGGSERSTVITRCTRTGCFPFTIHDVGTVSVIVNGFTKSVTYGAASTPNSIAFALAEALNSDLNSPVQGYATANVLIITARARGVATDYSLSATSATSSSANFSGSSFTAAVSGASLTGGQ